MERAPSPWKSRGKGIGIRDQVDDHILARPHADLVELRHGFHLIRGDGGVHAAGQNQAVGIEFLEDLRRLVGDRKRVAAHVHDQHVVALDLLGQLIPRRHRTRRGQIGFDAVLVQNGAQQPQSMILPLFMRTVRVNQIAEIAQIEPKNV